jgi:hypothetical protein
MNAEDHGTYQSITARLSTQWTTVLCKPTVTGDSRFIESGGNSVLAAELAARINAEFQVDLAWHAVLDVLTLGTFDDLASAVHQALTDPAVREETGPRITAEPPPVSEAELLRHLDALTDDEVNALLARFGAGGAP